MSDNSGEKSRNSMPIPTSDLTWSGNDLVPQVANTRGNPGRTPNLRGVEANTDENKGTPVSVPAATGPTHENATTNHGGPLDECC